MLAVQKKIQEFLTSHETSTLKTAASLAELICRPELNYDVIAEIDPDRQPLPREVIEQVEIQVKYEGYINKALQQVEKVQKVEEKKIPDHIDYDDVPNLAIEAKQKLKDIRPLTIGQASRISGVNPADISILMVYIESGRANKVSE